MSKFELKERPLLYKLNDRVMGYHRGICSGLVAGTIVIAEQDKSMFSHNKYSILLEREFITDLAYNKGATLTLNENEIIMFNEDMFKESMIHYKNMLYHQDEATKEHTLMIKSINSNRPTG